MDVSSFFTSDFFIVMMRSKGKGYGRGECDDDEKQGLLKRIWKRWWESKYQWQTLDRAERIGRVGFAHKILLKPFSQTVRIWMRIDD